MIDVRDIHPLTDFVRNTKDHMHRLKETKAPEVLTVNGRAELVVQDAASYQELLIRLERAELLGSLRSAHDRFTKPVDEVENELRIKHGF